MTKSTLRRWRQTFFDGPAVLNYPGRAIRGYRSVNVILSQWLHAFFVTRFTCAGGLLFLATLIVGLGGMTTLLMPLFLLFVTFATLFIINIIVGFATRPQVEIRRVMPDRSTAGETLRVTYELHNTGKQAAWDVQLDYIPMNPAIDFPEGRAMIAHLPAGASERVTRPVVVSERGRYLLPLPVADSAFPFGLWRWGSRGPASRALLVFPRYTPLEGLTTPPSVSLDSGNAALANRAGQSLEFLGCREFRFGDNPRFIHAPSWARHNQPVVKEFSDAFAGRVTLFIDTFAGSAPLFGRRRHAHFEASLSLAAAMVDYFTTRHCSLSVYAHEDEGDRYALHHDENEADLGKLLERFACLTHQSSAIFPEFSEAEMVDLGQTQGLMVMLLSWDIRRRAFIESLQEAGIDLRVIVVSKNRIEIDAGLGISVTTAEVLAGEVRDL